MKIKLDIWTAAQQEAERAELSMTQFVELALETAIAQRRRGRRRKRNA